MKYTLSTVLFILTIILPGFSQKIVIDKVVGVVGSHKILLSDIENQLLQYKAQGINFENPRCKVLEELMLQKLLLNQAMLDSLDVSDKEVETELDSRLENYIRQIGSPEKLEEYFNKSIEEMKADFRDLIRDQMLTRKMQSKITSGLKVTPAEVNKYFKSIPKDSLPLIKAELEYSEIVIHPSIPDVDIEAIKNKLRDYKKKAEGDPKYFGIYASLYSEDPGSRNNNGELGFISRGELVPEFAGAAFNLKPGEISDVVKTEYGYHIIQMVEKRGEQALLRHILLKPQANKESVVKAENLLDSIRGQILIDSIKFEKAALYYSQDEESRLNNGIVANPYTGSTKFEVDQIEPAIYKILNQLAVGEISKPFMSIDKVGNPVYMIVMLRSKSEPHIANLRDDYQRIQEMTLRHKEYQELEKWVAEKQASSYIKVDKEFHSCKYDFEGWIKK